MQQLLLRPKFETEVYGHGTEKCNVYLRLPVRLNVLISIYLFSLNLLLLLLLYFLFSVILLQELLPIKY